MRQLRILSIFVVIVAGAVCLHPEFQDFKFSWLAAGFCFGVAISAIFDILEG